MNTRQWLRRIAKYIADLGSWVWSLGTWLRRTRPLVWMAVVVVASLVSILVLWALGESCEAYIRFPGTMLQLIGVILVGVGLRDTRLAFEGQPTLWQRIERFWAAKPPLPRFTPKTVALEARVLVTSGAVFGKPRLRENPNPKASLEDRVAALEGQHARLFDEVGRISGEVNQKIGELSNSVETERADRQEGDERINTQLKKAVVGGLPLSWIGASCFFLGTIGGASPEICRLVGW